MSKTAPFKTAENPWSNALGNALGNALETHWKRIGKRIGKRIVKPVLTDKKLVSNAFSYAVFKIPGKFCEKSNV
jgi:hypothetical protein